MKFIVGVLLFCSFTMAFTTTIHWALPGITTFDIDIYTTTAPGTYPVIIFLTGFLGITPATSYSNLLTKIADQNVIVIAASKARNLLNTTAEDVEKEFAEFMIFITDPSQGAKKLFKKNKPETKKVVPDLEDRLSFLAHSAGCQVLTLYLTKRCGTKKAQVNFFIMLDPVDGRGPFDTSGLGFVTNPPNLLPFRTPVLIISMGLGNVPAFPGQPTCAPESKSNDRFYRSLSGPKALLNFTDYGHADMLDDSRLANNLCSTCSPLFNMAVCNYEQLRQDLANAVVNFTKGILNDYNGRRQLQFLQQPQPYFQSRVTIKSNIQQIRDLSGFCQNYL